MKKFDCALVVTHVAYRKILPFDPIEGPYSSLCQALMTVVKKVTLFGLPLTGYQNEIVYGIWGKTKKWRLWSPLGQIPTVKFAIDIVLSSAALILWSIKNKNKNQLVIGIDPLSCLPLWFLKNIFGYTLVFHCVDFNKNRFENKIMQRFYEWSDEWASRFSDQTWVICESLKEYKKKKYSVESYYLPNSVSFDPSIYKEGKSARKGNKMIWVGSLMTERQYGILFRVFSHIQTKVRPDMKFMIVPTRDHDKFEKYAKKYKIKNSTILRINGRLEFQKIAAKCDVGIALYDEKFGSTEFIEPMKIWDFLLCGLPFIVSREPSISQIVRDNGVAFFMKPKNNIPNDIDLKLFLSKKNLTDKETRCLKIAKKYDIDKQVQERLAMLLLSK